MTELPKTCGECKRYISMSAGIGLGACQEVNGDVFEYKAPPQYCPLRTATVEMSGLDAGGDQVVKVAKFSTPDYYNISECADLYEWNHKHPHSPVPVFEAITKCWRIGHTDNSRNNIRDAKAAIRALERYIEMEGEK